MTDFATIVLVDASPQAAYDAIVRPRDWWGRSITGETGKLGSNWTYRYKDMHRSTQRTSELVPGKRIVWDVIDAELSFLQDKSEWTGSKLVFDITRKDNKTEIRFTHVGLVLEVECYDMCVPAWTGLIQDSLKTLIETGEGLPDTVEKDAA